MTCATAITTSERIVENLRLFFEGRRVFVPCWSCSPMPEHCTAPLCDECRDEQEPAEGETVPAEPPVEFEPAPTDDEPRRFSRGWARSKYDSGEPLHPEGRR